MVHFNVPHDWFETNLQNTKRYSEEGKKMRVSLLGISADSFSSNIYLQKNWEILVGEVSLNQINLPTFCIPSNQHFMVLGYN